MRRRRGRHDAGQRRRAAARIADSGRVRIWSPRAGAGRCSSWPTRRALAIAHRLKQDVDQVRRRRDQHAAGPSAAIARTHREYVGRIENYLPCRR